MDIKELLEKMTLDEKIALLSGKNFWETRDFSHLGIPSLFLADGPCGIRKQEGKSDHLGINVSIPATATVSGACLAATWSQECFYQNGKLLGEEAARAGVDVLLAPAINIVRSPLCGRNFEYFSEDPYLTGCTAVEYTKGVQDGGVGACPKHFAVNNQETEREYVDAIIDERTLREIYLPAFEMVVKDAKPQAIMSALNQINGVYGAENSYLLKEILRDEWKFDGFTVSDWFGIVHPDKAVAAGMDLDMPYSNGVGFAKIKKAVEEGTISICEIDICCEHLLKAINECAKRRSANGCDDKEKMFAKHHEIVRSIAEEGIVLLKNEGAILPLNKTDKVAVIGYYAKNPRITLEGSAHVEMCSKDIPIEFIGKFGHENISYEQGYLEKINNFEDGEREEILNLRAIELARISEKVIYFMGQPSGTEMEGKDRKTISLPENQEKLLYEILKVNSNVIVVLANPSAVAMPWEKQVPAIFECFIAGQGFGSAIAKLLYGEVVPSGKLPVSFTKRLEDTSAYIDFPGNKEKVSYSEGIFVGYRYYDLKKTDLLFPFGHGLSYTTFEYSDLQLESNVFPADKEKFTVSVQLKNTGKYAAAETVQLYIGMFDTVVKRPIKELKNFQKVFLKPGETQQIRFILSKKDFAFYYEFYKEWYVPKGTYEILVGSSSADIRMKAQLQVLPEKEHLTPLSGWSLVHELRETEKGEAFYQNMLERMKALGEVESIFLTRDDLENEEKMNQIPLRFINLYTNGLIDNDELLAMIKEVNIER